MSCCWGEYGDDTEYQSGQEGKAGGRVQVQQVQLFIDTLAAQRPNNLIKREKV